MRYNGISRELSLPALNYLRTLISSAIPTMIAAMLARSFATESRSFLVLFFTSSFHLLPFELIIYTLCIFVNEKIAQISPRFKFSVPEGSKISAVSLSSIYGLWFFLARVRVRARILLLRSWLIARKNGSKKDGRFLSVLFAFYHFSTGFCPLSAVICFYFSS